MAVIGRKDATLRAADALEGNAVVNGRGEALGTIEDIMIDVRRGTVAYAVMSRGGPEADETFFAIPWNALTLDSSRRRFILASDQERLLYGRRPA